MDCEIILDLLPLYADDCCSLESRRAVEAHLASCPNCRESLQAMGKTLPTVEMKPAKPSRVQEWKASALQSVLLFAAFGGITFGVAQEASTDYADFTNSLWAFYLVIPVTGFLLSLANWYFVRLYPNRKSFVISSCCLTLLFTLVAYVWGLWHYGDGAWPTMALFVGWMFGPGLPGSVLSVFLCGLSAGVSYAYARLLGKV